MRLIKLLHSVSLKVSAGSTSSRNTTLGLHHDNERCRPPCIRVAAGHRRPPRYALASSARHATVQLVVGGALCRVRDCLGIATAEAIIGGPAARRGMFESGRTVRWHGGRTWCKCGAQTCASSAGRGKQPELLMPLLLSHAPSSLRSQLQQQCRETPWFI